MNEKDLLQSLTNDVAKKLTNKVIRFLQKDTTNLSSDDSGLKNIWDQVCVQKQGEESYCWEVYEDHITMITTSFVDSLNQNDLYLLNRETNEFLDWSFENPENDESPPINTYEITQFLIDDHIFPAAMEWSNARIRSYLNPDSDEGEADDNYGFRHFF